MRTPPPRSPSPRRPLQSGGKTDLAAAKPFERRARPRDGQPGGRIKTRLTLRLSLQATDGPAQAQEIRELLAGDISTGGVFVHCQNPPAVGELAHVEVCRPAGGLAFMARGRVVWRRPSADRLGRPAGFGLCFERLDLRDATVIRGMMDLLSRQQALLDGPMPDGRSLPAVLLYNLDDVTTDVVAILQTELPPEILRFVQGYEQVSHRDPFLWRWAYQGVSLTTLSCVDRALCEEVRGVKLLAVMFAVLLDDAVDRAVLGEAGVAPPPRLGGRVKGVDDDPLLLALCQIPLGGAVPWSLPRPVQAYYEFARRVYGEIHARLSRLPRALEFLGLVAHDLQELIQGVRLQHLVRQAPHYTSVGEARLHGHSGLPMMLSGTIDLCASPSFDLRETGLLREVLGLSQRMVHTASSLVSWEHQVETGNLGGAVVAHGLASGVLSLSDVDPVSGPRRADQVAAKLRLGRVDSHFLTEWLRDRYQVRDLSAHLRSVDMDQLLSAQQRLMWLQLSARGLV